MKEEQIWNYYGLVAILLVFYTTFSQVKPELARKLWTVYIFSAAIIGMMLSINK